MPKSKRGSDRNKQQTIRDQQAQITTLRKKVKVLEIEKMAVTELLIKIGNALDNVQKISDENMETVTEDLPPQLVEVIQKPISGPTKPVPDEYLEGILQGQNKPATLAEVLPEPDIKKFTGLKLPSQEKSDESN